MDNFPKVDILALNDDVLGRVFKFLTPKERVRASLVLKAWLRAESASPVRHSELILSRRVHQWPRYPEDMSRLRWDFRDSSGLLEVELGSKYVAPFLSLQPVLTRLEHLKLRDWNYTYEQAEQLLCIQSLENLQELSLNSVEPLSEGPGYPGSLGKYGSPDPTRQEYLDTCSLKAGLSLRKAVSKLPRMTCLSLKLTNIHDPDCAALQPWTHLRKLVVDNFILVVDLRHPPTSDVSGLEAMTRLTELHITVPFLDKQQDLGKLAQLQRLTLDYEPERRGDPGTTRFPFVYPEMDSVTKLSFSIGEEAKGLRLRDVLPRRSLESVKELELRHSPMGPNPELSSWQQWPMAWSRLTALTSLSCQLCHHIKPYIPAVLNRMTSLRKLDVSHDYGPDIEFDQEGLYGGDEDLAYKTEIVDKVIGYTRGLARLTSLVIDGNECIGQRQG